jgi:hypothetical protein
MPLPEIVLGSSLLLEPAVAVAISLDISPVAGTVAAPLAAVAVLLLEPAVTVAISLDVSPMAGAAASPLAAVAGLAVAGAGGCGRCSRPGGTDARPLHATQQEPTVHQDRPAIYTDFVSAHGTVASIQTSCSSLGVWFRPTWRVCVERTHRSREFAQRAAGSDSSFRFLNRPAHSKSVRRCLLLPATPSTTAEVEDLAVKW